MHHLLNGLLILLLTGLVGCGSSLPDLAEDSEPALSQLSGLSELKDPSARKARFVELMQPVIQAENERVRTIRTEIKALRDDAFHGQLSEAEKRWLNAVAADYRVVEPVTEPAFFEQLLKKVDVIPPSLVLAQAALESSWGTSRFARQANNLFGHWCFEKGCGIVPKKRAKGATHELARFDTVNASVRAYMLNLNRKEQYEALRVQRWKMRHLPTKPVAFSGFELAKGLKYYSELGEQYIRRVRALIRQNNLSAYDQVI